MPKTRNLTGKYLNDLWDVGAKHALYREDGKWYHQLLEFPGALFDANGYVVFETEKDYLESPYLQIRKDVHLSEGISAMPNYIRVTEKSQLQQISQTIRRVSENQEAYNAKMHDASGKPQGRTEVKRSIIENERIIRDTKVSSWVKFIHGYKCQICGVALQVSEHKLYAEAHHIRPLGNDHQGADVVENIMCVCPNHHALLDLGALRIELSRLRSVEGHDINPEYVDYHNTIICRKT